MFANFIIVVGVIAAVFLLGFVALIVSCYKKVSQGKALVRTGFGDLTVRFNAMFVFPVLHQLEIMDISLKTVEISRTGKDGLICKDNMRADIKVAFFVRVNKTKEDVEKVAQAIGCARASDYALLRELFEAKFSEGLKTIGKRFDFVDLYDSREKFKLEILEAIGRDLNGYVLDDCAIDYLEQTPITFLSEDNILDSEGIKKIADLTAQQKIKANQIRRDEQKVITKQNVEAREAILELERQLAEKEEKQKREVLAIKSREEAETKKIASEEFMKSEQARIRTEEELQVAEQNKQRQVIVATKAKEKTEAVEIERVQKERQLEVNERERIVELARIEKDKAIEEEKKNIQDVIRERVIVEKAVVVEEEKIKDTRAFALAERDKAVAIKNAEKVAEEALVQQIKSAEASKRSAELYAEQSIMQANADRQVAEKSSEAKKIMAAAKTIEEAATGLAEAQVMEAKSLAHEKQGTVEANIIEKKAIADAKGIEAKASALEKQGLTEANVLEQKGSAEARVISIKAASVKEQGLAEADVMEKKGLAEALRIEARANATKQLDGVGKEHEEFKLRLQQVTDIELAKINIQKDIANAQASVISEALKASNINIVGGETMFYENIMGAITKGKSIDSFVSNSQVIQGVQHALMNGNGTDGSMGDKIKRLVNQFGISSEDVKNLTISALLFKMLNLTSDDGVKGLLNDLMHTAKKDGLGDKKAGTVL
ncbi:MAG: flotillin family protein [Bacteroidota bacterium]